MNFFEKSLFVSAVELAARNGITTALRVLKPAAPSSNRAPTKEFVFRQLASAAPTRPLKAAPVARAVTTPAKPPATVTRAATPPKPPANRFAHLVALAPAAANSLTVAASQAASQRSAPTPAEFSAAAATLAMTSGPLAPWAERPSDAQVQDARAVMQRGEDANAAASAKVKAESAVFAARILAAGNFRGVRR